MTEPFSMGASTMCCLSNAMESACAKAMSPNGRRKNPFEDQRERASYEKQAKEMKRLATAAGQRAQWSKTVERRKKKKHSSPNGGAGTIDRGYLGHQAAKMMKRAKTIDARRERAVAEQKKTYEKH